MKNFESFQLTNEEADLVIGSRKGGRKGGKKGGRKGGKKGGRNRFLNSLSEEDQILVKGAITDLRSSDGWADKTRAERRAEIKAVYEPYKQV